MEPNPVLEASNCLAWIRINNFVNEYNNPLEFTKHHFLIDYMADDHPLIVTKKCLHPDTRVLTADFRWVSLRDIDIGQRILGVDEKSDRASRRKLRYGVIENKVVVKDKAVRLTMASGKEIIATPEHRFLYQRKGTHITEWREVKDFKVGGTIRFITSPWGKPDYESGWMGGFIDGEGSIRRRISGGIEAQLTQVDGPVLERVAKFLENNELKFKRNKKQRTSIGKKDVFSLRLSSSISLMRLLGMTRPSRFTDKESLWEGHRLPNGNENTWQEIVKIESLSTRTMIDIQTSTRTFIADGFISHNCAQVGLTVSEVLKSMHYAAYGKKNVIHTLQTSDVVDGFVSPKVNPIIEYNPKIKELLRSTDSRTLKRFGDNFVFYRGANAESQAINITGDVLCIDEYDRSNQNVVEIYRSRLDASQYKWRRYFSNPSAIGFGVDGLYNASDQRHWFVKCPKCKHRAWLEFLPLEIDGIKTHYVNVDKSIYACGKCHKELHDRDRILGEWVARYPDKNSHGYWFSQLMAPWKSAVEIIETQQTSSIEYFSNFVLGKAYTPTDLVVNRETILRSCKPALTAKTRVAIGVDNGAVKHWVAATPEGIFDYGKTEEWNDIERLHLMYDATMVIDALPDFTIPKQLVQKYRGKIFINYYVPDSKNFGAVRWGQNEEFGVVKTDRTKLLDLVASEIAGAKLLFRQHPGELEGYISHWNNVFRTTVKDEKTGIEKGNWTHQQNKPDHWVHATGYMRIALSRVMGGSFGSEFIEPKGATKEVVKTDYVDSYGRLHTNLGEQIERSLSGVATTADWRYN